MKTIFFIVLSVGLILFFSLTSSGQQELLSEMLQGKTTFTEITDTYQEYFQLAPESPEKQKMMKQFARWAWYTSFHLGPDGEFVNISKRTLQAVSELTELPPERSANGSWVFLGPYSTYLNNPDAQGLGLGRVDRIAFHPSVSTTIYVGTPAGGLWKTTDGGSNWTSISSYIPSLGISGIVVSHSDPNTLYVLTGDGDSHISGGFVNELGYIRQSAGVMVSHDGGTNWQLTGELSPDEYVGFCLVQHPTNANILLAGTSDGMFRTSDGGANWTQVWDELIYDIEFKPYDPSIVYASGSTVFIKSSDAGLNWFGYYYGCSNGRIEIEVTPAAPNNVYMLCSPHTTGNYFCGFKLSTNSGETFNTLCNTPNVFGDENGVGDQSQYDISLAVKPTDASKIIVGGLVVYKSTDGGNTFNAATTYWESGGNYIHPDIHYLAYNPLSNFLYAAGDGGFHRSLSDGNAWTDMYTGLTTTQFYHIDDYNSNQYTILGGCQDNGVKFRSSNTSQFSHINSGDGFDCAINYNNQYAGFISVNDRIRYFSNFTANSSQLITYLSNYYFPQIELNSTNPNILYYSWGTVKKYDLSTQTTTPFTGISGYWALKTCPSYVNRIYAAGGTSLFSTTGNMYVTSNGGSSWSIISDNTGFPSPYPRITDIGVNPVNSVGVFVCFGGYTDGVKVLYSSVAGSSWTNISYDLPNVPVWCVEVDAANNAYVGTDIGVFYHPNGATAWEPFYNNLPNVPVSDLAINETSNQLLASTFGRGIWSSTLRDPCPTTYAITSDVSGHYFRSASSGLAMNAKAVGGEGSYVVLRAGDYITLSTGFQVNGDAGNKFLAYNGACDEGLPPDYMGQLPIYPVELIDYTLSFTRHEGTLEVPYSTSRQKQVVLRLFQDGNVRIILADSFGKFIREVANFNGAKDTYTFDLDTSTLQPGLYYLYLVVNDQVDHLQELEI